MTETNNVIAFPSKVPFHLLENITTKEDIKENIEAIRQSYVQEILNMLVPGLFEKLEIAGFIAPEEEDDFFVKECAFIVESIRSHMFSYFQLKHPFQKLVEKVLVEDEEEVDPVNNQKSLIVADHVTINLKD